MKLKLLSCKDKNGNEKNDFMKDMKSVHPDMIGEGLDIFYTEKNKVFLFFWDDASNKALKTSEIIGLTKTENKLIVETLNSVYEFLRL